MLEDDEALQKLMATMIQRLGYRADLVSRGEDAVRAFQAAERDGEPIDGAVLDLTVPGGMGGCEVIQQLRALQPGFPALVSSGAANNPAIAEFQQHGFCGAIAKPYTVHVGAIRRGVGKTSAGGTRVTHPGAALYADNPRETARRLASEITRKTASRRDHFNRLRTGCNAHSHPASAIGIYTCCGHS